MKPDAVDAKILEALMGDGRASFREVALRTSLTTPTVSARMARMMKAGLIKKFVPVLSADSVNRGVQVLVTLSASPSSQERVANALARLPEVGSVYMTAGRSITMKLTLGSVKELQPFLKKNVLGKQGVNLDSTQVITNVVKDEPPSVDPSSLIMNLKCDYCGGDVTSSRPFTVVAGPSHYYFCCKTCRKAYLDKFGPRLAKINKALQS